MIRLILDLRARAFGAGVVVGTAVGVAGGVTGRWGVTLGSLTTGAAVFAVADRSLRRWDREATKGR